ncbi:MAG TPA: hypothetical protein VNA68_00180 [Candidatus Dormibacteraeota bacterium]|nr:hypothetical protein [Candidatus Dormibacteraeota bacterium]
MGKRFLASFFTVMLGVLIIAPSAQVLAATRAEYEACLGAKGTPLDGEGKSVPTATAGNMVRCDTGKELTTFINNINNALLFIAGAVAVVIIIIGGIGYVTSTGDPARITKAKNTILYAVMGLIVALLAYAVVGFVLTRL